MKLNLLVNRLKYFDCFKKFNKIKLLLLSYLLVNFLKFYVKNIDRKKRNIWLVRLAKCKYI